MALEDSAAGRAVPRTTRDLRAILSDWGVAGRAPETVRLVDELRQGEERLRRRWDGLSPEESDALLWRLAAADVPEALSWAGDAPLPELCERALALRGGLAGGRRRLNLRERARVLLHLAGRGRRLPRRAGDLLAWWDEATWLEPAVRLRVREPRWRTEGDGLPFTGMDRAWLFGPRPLAPGRETADPADIPELASGLVAFLRAGGLEPEVVAAHMRHLVGYVHPFPDGNGHTDRLLTCELLSRAGYGAPAMLAFVGLRRRREREWILACCAVLLGDADASTLVSHQLRLLIDAQAEALAALP